MLDVGPGSRQAGTVGQATPTRPLSLAARPGVGWTRHLLPFHCSASVPGGTSALNGLP